MTSISKAKRAELLSQSTLPNTSPLPAQGAQELVEEIGLSYGQLSENDRNLTPSTALKAISNLQDALGVAAKETLTDLRQNKSRFWFELIKNADDNDYTQANLARKDPYIEFNIYPEKIIVDNNEDGFTAANIKAICKPVGSTKTGSNSQEYIGEKGTGFKSAFLVASKVTIQSGPFSFFFEHPSGEEASGIGMLTPVYCTPDETLAQPLTRIILKLRDEVDFDGLAKDLFEEVPDVLLLWLKKLNRITINKYCAARILVRHTTFLRHTDERMRATLTKVSQDNGNPPDTSIKHYYITRTQLLDMPNNEQKSRSTTEVCLAFPVDGKDVPLVATQEVYSYLPLGSFGFHFLIHSKFHKHAGWPGFMKLPRNAAILDNVAQLFVEAALGFCEHRTLQYQWIRFLQPFPAVDVWASSRIDPHGFQFLPKVKEILATTPILRCYNHDGLRLIDELRSIPDEFRDGAGEPLLADSHRGTYLALGYTSGNDTFALISLGLRNLGVDEVIARVQEDLDSPLSKLKGKETPLDWHQRAAKFLLHSFMCQCVSRLKRMNVLPLQDGTFTSIQEGRVYFPENLGGAIPTDLGLRLIDPEAVKENDRRRQLFSGIGVTSLSVWETRDLIFKKYEEDSRMTVTLRQSVKHLRYLHEIHPVTHFSWKDFGTGRLQWRNLPNINFGGRFTAMLSQAKLPHFEEFNVKGTTFTRPSTSDRSLFEGKETEKSSNETELFSNLDSRSETIGKEQRLLNSTLPITLSLLQKSIAVASRSCQGTKDVIFVPKTIKEPEKIDTGAQCMYQSICCQAEFENFSYEELRLADHPRRKREYESLWVFDDRNEMISTKNDVYFLENEFSGSPTVGTAGDSNDIQYPYSCLHSAYFITKPKTQYLGKQSWNSWLNQHMGIKRLPLVADPVDISKASEGGLLSTSVIPELAKI